MNDSDIELLREYVERGSETAFGELVARHVNLVYSAARRQVNDAHLAQDVTQAVFVALARKAGKLRHAFLAGWLYRSACFESAKIKRTAARRQTREREVTEMHSTPDSSSPDWDAVAPLLDEAMTQLREQDRDALLLRYFQNRDLKAVGERLGASEDAAQKRVARALERLRALLVRRGVTLSAAALATTLAGQAVNSAPAGLAAGASTVALASAAAIGGGAFSILHFMTTTSFKAAAVAVVVIAAVITPVLQNQSAGRLREENTALREQLWQLERLRAENARLANLRLDADELERLRKDRADLLRLRGEVTSLRSALQEQKQRVQPSPLQAAGNAEPPKTNLSPAQLTIEVKFIEASPLMLANAGLGTYVKRGRNPGATTGVLTELQARSMLQSLEQTSGVDILTAPKVTTLDRRRAQVKVQQVQSIVGEQEQVELHWLGPLIDVLPVVSDDRSAVDLTMTAIVKQFLGYTESEPRVPIFRDYTANAHTVVGDGQTVLLGGAQKQSVGELPDDARQILVMVTPTLIDPAGNRLRSPEEEPGAATTPPAAERRP